MPEPLVFVLMPFGEPFDAVYAGLIEPPLMAAGFRVRRADSDLHQRNILQDVVRGIADAALVLADVTGLNGNVLYELGLAHGLGKRTVMLTQDLQELPFDLRPYRAFEFSTLFHKAPELPVHLTGIAEALLAGTAEFSNPVQDFAPEFVLASRSRVGPAGREPETPSQSDDDSGEDADPPGTRGTDGPGLFDALVAIDRIGNELSTTAEAIAQETGAVATRLKHHTARLDKAQASLGNRASGAFLTIARDTAKDLSEYSGSVSAVTGDLRRELQEFVGQTDAVARRSRIEGNDDVKAAKSLLTDLEALENVINESSLGVLGFAEALSGLPHVSKEVTRAARYASGVVQAIADDLDHAASEISRSRGLLEERVENYRQRSTSVPPT